MQITKATEYLVRIILELSLKKNAQKIISIQELSEKQDIPIKYLRKLIMLLITNGFVRSYRGSKGGIKLIKTPDEISMYDVIVVSEGEITLNVCLAGKDECNKKNKCPIHKVWNKTQTAMVKELKNTNFKELAKTL